MPNFGEMARFDIKFFLLQLFSSDSLILSSESAPVKRLCDMCSLILDALRLTSFTSIVFGKFALCNFVAENDEMLSFLACFCLFFLPDFDKLSVALLSMLEKVPDLLGFRA